MPNKIKCKMKTCLNNEAGSCGEFIPLILQQIQVDTISCPFFEEDRDKSLEEIILHGGMLGAIAKMNGKRTVKEILADKKKMRKPRSDKVEKKPKVKKIKKDKENSLKELF